MPYADNEFDCPRDVNCGEINVFKADSAFIHIKIEVTCKTYFFPPTMQAMYGMIFVRNTMQRLGKLMIDQGVEITYVNN